MPKKGKGDRIVTILSPNVNKRIKQDAQDLNLSVSSFIKLLILIYYKGDMKIEITQKSDVDYYLDIVTSNANNLNKEIT